MQLRALACLFFTVSLAGFSDAEMLSAQSPDGQNEIQLMVGKELSYQVLRHNKTRIAPTPLSLTIEGKGTFGIAPKLLAKRMHKIEGAMSMPLYKKDHLDKAANEIEASFEGGYSVILRARNDGVAYRFETSIPSTVKVLAEEAALTFPSPDLTAYVGYNWGHHNDPQQDKLQNSWESIYAKMKISEIAPDKQRLVYLPLLVLYPDGGALAVTESDLLDYPGWNLYRKGSDPAKLSPWMANAPVEKTVTDNQRQRHVNDREPWLVETTGTRNFPWRVFILADEPIKLVEADIVQALATPSHLADTSWVKPGKVAWDWWNDWNVSHVPFHAECNTETYKYYIDFAQKNHLEYVIFDEGWSVHLKVMEINPAVDVPALVKYAADRGIGIMLWCSWPQLVDRQQEVFKKYADMGIKGFKIDFMDRDDAFVVNFLAKTASIAANYHLILDYHGMFKPTGLQVTYPNILNFEGVHGLEQLKWEETREFPMHDCQIVFTRMVAGPLDYTPGSMLNQTREAFHPCNSQPTSQGTRCHQMALLSLFEAPLQMLCDSPTQYMRNQECTDFMTQIPTVWDETVGLAGKVGEYAAIARRKGTVWYVSVINNWEPRTLKLETASFLKKGEWDADIFADGLNADRDATDYTHTSAVIPGGEHLVINLGPGGG